MASTDKLIVTNLSAMKKKYGTQVQRILDAVDRLITADQERGLRTQLLALDDRRAMRSLRATPVTSPGDRRQVKNAIDDVFRMLRPDYLVILGSYDVVPHQRLKNPMFHHDDDDDQFVPSDLPYACETPYSIQCRDFRGPTRIVGRIPDLTRESDPSYLVGLLKTAASWVRRPRDQYADYFGLSAEIWAKSTALSLDNTFGSSSDLKLVPPGDFHWPPALLKRRAHFINCHGAEGAAFFYGQPKSGEETYPDAHSAAYLKGKVTQGTVVAAECCFGAELYPPHVADGQPGICNTYLQESAYGFFGSSTIAYGPSSGNGEADYICQYFLQEMLAGASLGRAALEARQTFVQQVTILDPSNLKTLAQFNLMGDPSIHPVAPASKGLTRTKAYKRVFPEAKELPVGRQLRRQKLIRNGLALAQMAAAVKSAPNRQPRGKVRHALQSAARESRLRNVRFATFVADDPAKALYRRAKVDVVSQSEVHVAFGRHRISKRGMPQVICTVAILATVQNGEIVRMRRLHSR